MTRQSSLRATAIRTMFVALAMAMTADAAFATPILSVTPAATQVSVGGAFSVDIRVTGVADLFAFGFDVDFGPGPLRIVGVAATEGPFLSSGGGGTTFAHGGFDNVNGTLASVVAALSGAGPAVSGSGVLASIGFMAVAIGSTNIVLSNIQLLDSTLTQIDFDPPVAGAVRVSSVPEPGTLLLAAIGGVMLSARRRAARRLTA